MPTMHGALIGSYEHVAAMLDDYATACQGVEGVMRPFDDFVEGMDKFGQRIQPLMATRRHVLEAA